MTTSDYVIETEAVEQEINALRVGVDALKLDPDNARLRSLMLEASRRLAALLEDLCLVGD